MSGEAGACAGAAAGTGAGGRVQRLPSDGEINRSCLTIHCFRCFVVITCRSHVRGVGAAAGRAGAAGAAAAAGVGSGQRAQVLPESSSRRCKHLGARRHTCSPILGGPRSYPRDPLGGIAVGWLGECVRNDRTEWRGGLVGGVLSRAIVHALTLHDVALWC